MSDKGTVGKVSGQDRSPSSRRYAVESAIAIAKDRTRPWKNLRERANRHIPPWDACGATGSVHTATKDDCDDTDCDSRA